MNEATAINAIRDSHPRTSFSKPASSRRRSARVRRIGSAAASGIALPTVSYLTKIARLGGYLARAKDPPPGNIVMWRGLSRLNDIALGATLQISDVGN